MREAERNSHRYRDPHRERKQTLQTNRTIRSFCSAKKPWESDCSVRPSCKALFSLEERVGYKKCCLIEVIAPQMGNYFIHF